MTYAEACQMLDKLYEEIPQVACAGLCTDSCGPLALSVLERKRIARSTSLRTANVTGPVCPMLRRGRCTVYKLRPLICRLYGATRNMVCPHGCLPDRWLEVSEWEALLRLAEEISQTLFPERGTVSFHTPAAIVQAQERSAELLCAVLGQGGHLSCLLL